MTSTMQRDKLAIAAQFKSVDPQAHYQNNYYGAYNSLLSMLFPFHEGFQISPRWIIRSDNAAPFKCATYFQAFVSFTFVVQIYGHTVFFLQIGEDPSTDDNRMRAMFSECIDVCKLPNLYGVSTRDTRCALYKLNVHKRELVPARLPESDLDFPPKPPAEWWKHDVLKEQGFAKLREIAEEIKEMVKANHDKLVAKENEGALDE